MNKVFLKIPLRKKIGNLVITSDIYFQYINIAILKLRLQNINEDAQFLKCFCKLQKIKLLQGYFK